MLTPNTLLQNRYLIEKLLGQGGMGAVYQAVDKRFDTTVALKETLVTDDNLRKAFEREARLLNKLRHQSLPHVIDFFSEGTGQFLVMQFIPGEDLGELLDRTGRPFPVELVAKWADAVLAALEYLHAHEPPIVHRDIKPQNIKLTPQNEVILLDFGLSKGSAADVSMAAGGASVAGYTPHFAPLEQIRGAGTNPRSDLYSLAATCYLLLAARTPPDALERASALLGGRPDPLQPVDRLNPSVPPGVASVLHVAMSQMPEHRWISATAMRSALREAVQNGSSTQVQRAPATTPVDATVQLSRPVIPQPPSSFPQSATQQGGYSQAPTSAPTMMPAPPPQQNQPAPYRTAPGLFDAPGPSVWQQPPSNALPASYNSTAPPVSKLRPVRWTLFVLWIVVGFFVSLIGAAIIAVAAFGDDPPTQATLILTILLYLLGAVSLLIWAKI